MTPLTQFQPAFPLPTPVSGFYRSPAYYGLGPCPFTPFPRPSLYSSPDSALDLSSPSARVPSFSRSEETQQAHILTPDIGLPLSSPSVQVADFSRPEGSAQFYSSTPDSGLDLSPSIPQVPISAFRPYRRDKQFVQWSSSQDNGLDVSTSTPARIPDSAFRPTGENHLHTQVPVHLPVVLKVPHTGNGPSSPATHSDGVGQPRTLTSGRSV